MYDMANVLEKYLIEFHCPSRCKYLYVILSSFLSPFAESINFDVKCSIHIENLKVME